MHTGIQHWALKVPDVWGNWAGVVSLLISGVLLCRSTSGNRTPPQPRLTAWPVTRGMFLTPHLSTRWFICSFPASTSTKSFLVYSPHPTSTILLHVAPFPSSSHFRYPAPHSFKPLLTLSNRGYSYPPPSTRSPATTFTATPSLIHSSISYSTTTA